MDFNYFDIVILSIVLLLGLKGILNGFFKEVFGLVGIIGGIVIASRYGEMIGAQLSENIFHFTNPSAVSFTGFLATLMLFWFLMVLLGFTFGKLVSLSGLGIYDRILGFIVGASKFFLILSVFAQVAYNFQTLRSTIDSALQTSKVFPILLTTGSYIMKIDSSSLQKKVDNAVEEHGNVVDKMVEDVAKEKIKTLSKEH